MNTEVTIIEPEQLEYQPAKTLLRLVEKSQQTVKNAKIFKQTIVAFPALFREFEESDIDVQFGLENDWIAIRFTGDGDKLKDVWGLLRRNGFNTNNRPKKGDTEFYSFWTHDGHAQLFMCFTSSLCKRVKVGTKMVEQDIFETQCGDLPEIEADSTEITVAEVADDIPF
jgi:hypothetical protein